MGADPTAIIYYGFRLPESGDDDYDYEDANELWQKTHHPPQWKKSPQNIKIDWVGGEDCPTYFVSADGLTIKVCCDKQEPLVGHDFGPRPEADRYLREFCGRFNLPWSDPGWHLAVRYF